METKRFMCEGDLCHPKDFTKPVDKNAYVNICVAELINNVWMLPSDWKVIDGKPYCPRCWRAK